VARATDPERDHRRPSGLAHRLQRIRVRIHNRFLAGGFTSVFYDGNLVELCGTSTPSRAAIGDHLCTIFADLMANRPSLIVELGTRGGESTRTILAAARHLHARLLSIDVNPCGDLDLPPKLGESWTFVQADDVDFGRAGFVPWCASRRIEPAIGALFIDTSHHYEHTAREIQTWFPYVSADGIVLFHDTNMGRLYRRLDNTLGRGWDNDRGVIRAIEEYLNRSFDETKTFVDVADNWLVRHYPYSSGLTLLKKLSLPGGVEASG
jgi:cephalosporin hydroxylase